MLQLMFLELRGDGAVRRDGQLSREQSFGEEGVHHSLILLLISVCYIF